MGKATKKRTADKNKAYKKNKSGRMQDKPSYRAGKTEKKKKK